MTFWLIIEYMTRRVSVYVYRLKSKVHMTAHDTLRLTLHGVRVGVQNRIICIDCCAYVGYNTDST